MKIDCEKSTLQLIIGCLVPMLVLFSAMPYFLELEHDKKETKDMELYRLSEAELFDAKTALRLLQKDVWYPVAFGDRIIVSSEPDGNGEIVSFNPKPSIFKDDAGIRPGASDWEGSFTALYYGQPTRFFLPSSAGGGCTKVCGGHLAWKLPDAPPRPVPALRKLTSTP